MEVFIIKGCQLFAISYHSNTVHNQTLFPPPQVPNSRQPHNVSREQVLLARREEVVGGAASDRRGRLRGSRPHRRRLLDVQHSRHPVQQAQEAYQ